MRLPHSTKAIFLCGNHPLKLLLGPDRGCDFVGVLAIEQPPVPGPRAACRCDPARFYFYARSKVAGRQSRRAARDLSAAVEMTEKRANITEGVESHQALNFHRLESLGHATVSPILNSEERKRCATGFHKRAMA